VSVVRSAIAARQAPGEAAPAPLVEDFPAVFDAELPYVWASLRRLGVRPADLEDVTHDVFIHVYRRFHERDPARPVRPWLFAFACRVAADYRRLARHRREVLGGSEEGGSGSRFAAASRSEPADEAFARMEGEALVHAALETLEPDRRAVFVLHELDECPIPEVARALDIPVNTAYTRLRLAREGFAAAVKRLRVSRRER